MLNIIGIIILRIHLAILVIYTILADLDHIILTYYNIIITILLLRNI